MTRIINSAADLASAADQCVKCGLCLPYCPTYHVLRDEADSPRGRISLIQGLAEGKLSLSEHLVQHLDRCLLCQSCERVCPAKVPFHDLMIGARQQVADSGNIPGKTDHRFERLPDRAIGGKLLAWTRLAYSFSGLQWLLRHSGLLPAKLARAEGYLPPPSLPLANRGYYAAKGPEIGRVGLFAGCMGRDFDTHTLKSAIRLLTAFGYTVILPHSRNCCGAMHLHQGDIETARAQAQESIAAFSGIGVDAVLVTSSACAATLIDAEKPVKQAVPPIFEVCRFLVQCAESERKVGFRPMAETVTVHTPCSQANALRDHSSIIELLSRIPEIELDVLSDRGNSSNRCCGGAGRYMLEQPELADQIREQTLEDIAAGGAGIVVTTNIGCALHIGKGLRENGSVQRIMHPVTLMARQLANN